MPFLALHHRCASIASHEISAFSAYSLQCRLSAIGQKPSTQIAVVSVNVRILTLTAETPIHPVDNFQSYYI